MAMHSASGDAPRVNHRDIRAALNRIATNRPFDTSPKLTSFLRYVVESTLAGGGDRLKGYTIAVEALGRPESFDPQIDPIVRVEALRLRRALARYYDGAGADDPIVVDLPRGRYVPIFRRRAPARSIVGWMQVLRAVGGALCTGLAATARTGGR
jgi:hypothetical protein